MKSTGIVRKLDELGRITIPREIRRVLDINIKDPIEVFVDDEKIILRKYEVANTCVVTGEVTNENKVYPGNITLSPKGAQILLEKLKEGVTE